VLTNCSILGGDESPCSSFSSSASCSWCCCSSSCSWRPILESCPSYEVGGASAASAAKESTRVLLSMEMEQAEVTISFIAALMVFIIFSCVVSGFFGS